MKAFRLAILCLTLTCGMARAEAAPVPMAALYNVHLFFESEQEFIDTMVLRTDSSGRTTGMMDVPNDFKGPLRNIVIEKDTIRFDLFVPKNASRPRDLIFHYEGKFFDVSRSAIAGFVTIGGRPEFVASFVAFRNLKRAPAPTLR